MHTLCYFIDKGPIKQYVGFSYLPAMMFLKFVQGIRTANSDIITAVVKPLIISISGVRRNEMILEHYYIDYEHHVS